jgi:conjugal transfer pilus assembly protein TraL
MHGQDEAGYIPKYLDAQEKFIFWDFDQAVLALLLMGFGATMGALITGMVVGGFTAWQYGRIKAGKHPRFAMHLMYWWLPPSFGFVRRKTTPPSDMRYFLG